MLKGRINKGSSSSEGAKLGIAGRLKIGVKVKNADGKEYPKALDHFIMDAPEDYKRAFAQAYGEKPSKIEIVFLSDDPAHSCREELQVRNQQGKLVMKSDGDDILVSEKSGWRLVPQEKINKHGGVLPTLEAAAAHYNSSRGVETVLTLRFMIVRLKGVFAEFTLTTKGIDSSIQQIVAAFDSFKQFAGFVTMVTFDLMVELVKSDRAGANTVYPVLKLVPNIGQDNIERLRELVGQGQNLYRLGPISDATFDNSGAVKMLGDGTDSGN